MTTPSPALGIEIADDSARLRQPRAGAEPPAAARWKAAEARLYPLVVVDSRLYEAAVTLVREVADVLRRRCGTVTELVDVDPAAILAGCPSASVMSAFGLDPGTAFDAACAYRWRELTAEQADAGLDADQDGSR
jgi:hypothetical protein